MKFTKILFLSLAVFLSACSHPSGYKIKSKSSAEFQHKMQLTVLWDNKNDDGTSGHYLKLSHYVADGKAFTASYNGVVKAINVADGKTIWETRTKTSLTSGIGANDKLIFIGASNGQVLALRQSDGKIIWHANVNSKILARPAACESKVIIKTENGELTAFNAMDGKKLWSYVQKKSRLNMRSGSSPVISGDYIICGFASGQLMEIDLNSGKLRWKRTISKPVGGSKFERLLDVTSDPVVINDIIYATTYHGYIAALSLDGRFLWKSNIFSHEGVAINLGRVYTVDHNGVICSYNTISNKVEWRQEALFGRNLTAPVIYKNTIVVGDESGHVYFFSLKDGKFVSEIKIGSGGILVAPIVADNGLYVYSQCGRLVKI